MDILDAWPEEDIKKVKILVDRELSLPKKKRREYQRLLRYFGPYKSPQEKLQAMEKAITLVSPKLN